MSDLYSLDSEEFQRDPFPILKRLREEAPVHRHVGGYWSIARYADVSAGVRNHAQFSNVAPESKSASSASPGTFAPEMAKRRLSKRDEPDHRKLRALMNPSFFPRTMTALQPKIEVIVQDLVREMRDKQRGGVALDFVRDFAYPLTTLSINCILGVPDEIRDLYRDYTATIDDNFGRYLEDLVRHKQRHPGDDLTTEMIRLANEGHDLLPMEDVHYYLAALWTGGTWTTTLLVANAAAQLQARPDVRAALRQDAGLLPGFVEEMLRFDPPVPFTAKKAISDVSVGGKTIPKGDTVLFLYAAANRDPDVFSNPEEFDVRRHPNKHLAFSEGIHHCLGAPLARLETVCAFKRLVQEDVGLELDLAKAFRKAELTLSGYRSIPATVSAR